MKLFEWIRSLRAERVRSQDLLDLAQNVSRLIEIVAKLTDQVRGCEARLDQVGEEVEAIERTLGTNPQGDDETVAARIARVENWNGLR